MEITEAQLDQLVQVLDLDDDDVRRDYSGRGMYGATCVGLVINVTDVQVGVALAQVFEDDVDAAWDVARSARTDSMGRSTIIYFPGLEVVSA